jgi:hypothetical protein
MTHSLWLVQGSGYEEDDGFGSLLDKLNPLGSPVEDFEREDH